MLILFIKKYRAVIFLTLLLSCASVGVTMALLSLINDLASRNVIADNYRPLAAGAGWLAALLITGAASQYLLARLGSDLVAQLRVELAQRFIELDYMKLADRKHTVFGSLIEDIQSIAPLVLMAPLLTYNILLSALFTVYLASISALMLVVLVAFLSLTFVASFFLERNTRKKFDVLRGCEEEVFEGFRTISEGKKEMSLNKARARHFSEKVLHPAIEGTKSVMVDVHTLWGFNDAWSTSVMYGAVFLVVYLGYAAFDLSQATVVRFVIGALFLVGPMNFIINTGKQVSLGFASLRHLERVGLDVNGELEADKIEQSQSSGLELPWSSISLQNVCYRYPNAIESSQGIGPLNLNFSRGEMTFIVGGNGSGKSTLLLLLCSLLTPDSGDICIDGRPVRDALSDYRGLFSGVFGDFFLFPHVIDLSGKEISDSEILALIEKLGLTDQVEVSDGRIVNLNVSTGQRKRLALLQCYAEDRDIFFFDEWAADQDAHFRDYFYMDLLPALRSRGKTVIAISHDDRYFDVADRVIGLEAGRALSDTRIGAVSDIGATA